jgi:recombination protein RecT
MGQAIANREKMAALKDYLRGNSEKIAAAIPGIAARYLTPERAMRAILLSVEREPLLLACTQSSLIAAAIQAVQYGLEPGGALGEAALIAYGDRCEMRFMARGLITLAMRHGSVRQVDAEVVREGDYFEVERGLTPMLVHRPVLTKTAGAIVAAYAIARLEDGGQVFEVAPGYDLEKARALAARSRAWADWPGEMAKKFAIRRLLKRIPSTPELADAIEQDYADERGETGEHEPSRGEPVAPRRRVVGYARLAHPIAGLDEAAPSVPVEPEASAPTAPVEK